MRERYLPLVATIVVFAVAVHHRRASLQATSSRPGARPPARRQRLHHHRGDRRDFRHHFGRYRPVDRLDDRLCRRVMANLDTAGWDPSGPSSWCLPSASLLAPSTASSSTSARSSPSSSRWPACSCCAAPASWSISIRCRSGNYFVSGSTAGSMSTCPDNGFLTGAAIVMLSCWWWPSSSPTSRASAPMSMPSAATALGHPDGRADALDHRDDLCARRLLQRRRRRHLRA